jgi:hypothetical protein
MLSRLLVRFRELRLQIVRDICPNGVCRTCDQGNLAREVERFHDMLVWGLVKDHFGVLQGFKCIKCKYVKIIA